MKNLILIVLIVLLGSYLHADTNIPAGSVFGNWSLNNSPYLILGNIDIPNGQTLSIEPGCYIEFQGHYRLDVDGTLLASGNENSQIQFTINDTTGISNLSIPDGGWHGIRFNYTSSTNDSSRIEYCKFEFGKAMGPDLYDRYGGAIFTAGFAGIVIQNCIFENNYAHNGGAIANLDCASTPKLFNNILSNNHVERYNAYLGLGGAVYCYDINYLHIVNNLFSNNSAYNGGGLYFENIGYSCYIYNNTIVANYATYSGGGLYNYNYGLRIVNSILWDNQADYNNPQFHGYGEFFYCNVQGGTGNYPATNCIDTDPFFLGTGEHPYSLQQGSHCIDAGTPCFSLETDLMGNPRIFGFEDGIIDIGAYEFQGNANYVQAPTLSLNSGSYQSTIELIIECSTVGAEIYYTLDGSEPTQTSNLYSAPIFINYDLTLKTRAYFNGMTPSLIITAEYLIGHLAGNLSGILAVSSSPYVVESNITLQSGNSLEIEPGVEIIFMGNYEFKIYGSLIAEGTPSDSILFTLADTTGFYLPDVDTGGWGGLRIDIYSEQDCSFKHCKIEFGKNYEGTYLTARGGAILIESNGSTDIINCTIENCKAVYGGGVNIKSGSASIVGTIFRYNSALSGGGLSCGTPDPGSYAINNIFEDNEAEYSSGIGIAYGPLIISNCTLVDNISEDNYLLGVGWGGSAIVMNSIFWRNANSSDIVYIGSNTSSSFYNCNIEGGFESFVFGNGAAFNGVYVDNINVDPGFSGDILHPFSLAEDSYCINTGLEDMSNYYMPDIDFMGNPRIYDGIVDIIDIGAYEFQGEPTVVAKPILLLDSGFYPGTQTLEITCSTPNAIIYYTTDGTDPDQNSILYNQSILIEQSTTIKTRAYCTGYSPSLISTGDYFFGTSISGDVSGTLLLENSPYILVDSLVVLQGEVLTVSPGVQILATGPFAIHIQGSFFAEGTETDSISFSTINSNVIWRGFFFDETSDTEESIIKHCIIERSMNFDADEYTYGGAFYIYSFSNLTISNCRFENNAADMGGVFYLIDSSPQIKNCLFRNNIADNYGGVFSCRYNSNPIIEENLFIDNSAGSSGGTFYYSYSSGGTISNNIISFSSAQSGGAFYCDDSSPTILNNLFHNNSTYSDGCALYLTNSSTMDITNCTFTDNFFTNPYYDQSVIYCIESSSPIFNNCIFWNPDTDEIEAVTSFQPCYPSFYYCLAEGGLEQFTGSNNLDLEPMFVNPEDNNYQLLEDSPCIDSGTPDTSGLNLPEWDLLHNERIWDGDGNGIAIIDIGAYEYGAPSVDVEDPIIQTQNIISLKNYPNPFNPMTTIAYTLPSDGMIGLKVYNIKGQVVKTLIEGEQLAGSYETVWNGKDNNEKSVSTGIYFYKLSTKNKTIMRKMLMLK
ncbi:MAG: chitobiase/beta-hexosaminidase C-terminal domain-containing protein [Candidatus Cloacimonetes bacterium]|nr:chitobiase/beta-hexosaminidase C-terminal domain-containing protein [Candidatus Cloacimonadota bacterium]